MADSGETRGAATRGPRRRIVLGPVVVTAALVLLAVSATVSTVVSAAAPAIIGTGPPIGAGWVLAWLALGLTAGYALSGSV